jgi:hypothetical protein
MISFFRSMQSPIAAARRLLASQDKVVPVALFSYLDRWVQRFLNHNVIGLRWCDLCATEPNWPGETMIPAALRRGVLSTWLVRLVSRSAARYAMRHLVGGKALLCLVTPGVETSTAGTVI